MGKKSSEQTEKNVFLIFTRISLPKNGGKNARKNFSRNTLIVREKNVGKKIVGKNCEKRFLYSHEYRDQKMKGTKSAKQFFQKHTNSTNKIVGKKIVGKKCEKRFLYSHEYRHQNMGGKKTRETIFPETHE